MSAEVKVESTTERLCNDVRNPNSMGFYEKGKWLNVLTVNYPKYTKDIFKAILNYDRIKSDYDQKSAALTAAELTIRKQAVEIEELRKQRNKEADRINYNQFSKWTIERYDAEIAEKVKGVL